MPQRAWSAKRERQYEHIKRGLKQGGRPTQGVAEEIAARTVNKERARAGEARQRSRTSRAGHLLRAAGAGSARTRAPAEAGPATSSTTKRSDLGIRGRSKMNKSQLLAAVNRRTGRRSA